LDGPPAALLLMSRVQRVRSKTLLCKALPRTRAGWWQLRRRHGGGEELDFRWHRWRERDRDIHLSLIAVHCPVSAQSILHVIKSGSSPACTDSFVKIIHVGVPMSLVAIEKQITGCDAVGGPIIPLDHQFFGGIARSTPAYGN